MSINEPATEEIKEPVKELSYRESEEASYVPGADPFNDPSLVFDPNFADDKQYDPKEKKAEDEVAQQYISRTKTASGFNRDAATVSDEDDIETSTNRIVVAQ